VSWVVALATEQPWAMETGDRKNWKLEQIVRYYSFWAALGNLIAVAALMSTAGWWASPKLTQAPSSVPQWPGWFWAGILAATIFCGTAASMRMNYGFVHDEDYSARRVIAGPYKRAPGGEISLGKLKWIDTLYYYSKPNNHVLHSVFGRLCWSLWRSVAPPVNWHMKEWVIRIPAWIGGVGAVWMLGVLLGKYFSPLAGVLAAWLLALNPWHIRFTSEARGYSLLLCILPMALYFWLRAFRENRWRWWCLYSASQFALIYCYPGALYVLLVLNGATAAWILSQLLAKVECPIIARWYVSNCFAAMAAVQLTLPLVPQLQNYLKTDEAQAPLGISWIGNTASHFFLGVPWSKANLNFPYPEALPYAMSHPIFFGVMVLGFSTLIALGFAANFWRRGPEYPIIAATLLVPGFLGFAAAKLFGHWLFEWYLIYLLPGLVAGGAMGAVVTGRWLAARFNASWMAALPGVVLILSYAVFSQPFRSWFCTNPMEPVKEAVLAIRGTLDPNSPSHRERLTGVLLSMDDYYDPHAKLLRTPGDFLNLLQTADQRRLPLYVMVPHPWAAAFNVPILWRLFNESGLFTDFRYFRGLDQTNDRVVARYAPDSVKEFEFGVFFRGREGIPNPNSPPLEFPNPPKIYR
ncbi:MAG TPA: glycosyltransferase family 39 protein, partial [Terrimicrobiaceae bacterium]